MSYKQNLKYLFYRIKCRIKSLQLLTLISSFSLNIIMPVFSIYTYLSTNYIGNNEEKIKLCMFIVLPIMSIWWTMLSMKEYIEGQGFEVIYVYSKKTLIFENLMLYFIESGNRITLYIILNILFSELKLFFVCVEIICFFYFCLMNFVFFRSNSLLHTFMTLLIYSIINILYKSNSPISFFYSSALGNDFHNEFFVVYLPMLICGTILLFWERSKSVV